MANKPIAGSAQNNNVKPVPKQYTDSITEMSWKGISFPITNLKTNIEHNLAIHEYVDRDSAHVEATGRKPITVSATILFYNHIIPAKTETWAAGNLFPNTYGDFITAAQEADDSNLKHPFLGSINAKLQQANTTMDADRRGGVEVEASWIETISIDLSSNTQSVSVLKQLATDFTSELDNVKLILPTTPELKTSLLDLIDSISGFISLVGMVGKQLLGTIDKVLYHLNKLIFSINQLNNNILNTIKIKALALYSTAIDIKNSLNNFGKPSLYKVPTNTTMGEIANILNVDIITLMKQNPQAASKPVVKAGTIIIYFKL